jgi:hypothetical protein
MPAEMPGHQTRAAAAAGGFVLTAEWRSESFDGMVLAKSPIPTGQGLFAIGDGASRPIKNVSEGNERADVIIWPWRNGYGAGTFPAR